MACTSPKELFVHNFDTPIQVPCGHCLACRRARVKDWTFRLVAELPYHSNAMFITATLDEQSYAALTRKYSLDHRPIQLFLKRLRKTLPCKVKYFVCGEYGGETYRAHWHFILFGWWPSDARKDQNKENSWHSDQLTTAWGNGDISFGLVTPDSCAYCAGYVNKKLHSSSVYAGIKPPYVAVSGGIGLQYCLDNREQLIREMCVYMPDGARLPLPRYYKKKLEIPTEKLYEHYLQAVDNIYHPSRYRNKEKLVKEIKKYLAQKNKDLETLARYNNQRDGIIT